MSGLCQRLSLAAVTLVSSGAAENLQAQQSPWQIDTSYLSYVETDDRVSVSKALANLTRANENTSVNFSLVHDTMSGASPTGAIRSSDSAVTYTSASGGSSPGGQMAVTIQRAASKIRVFRQGWHWSRNIILI